MHIPLAVDRQRRQKRDSLQLLTLKVTPIDCIGRTLRQKHSATGGVYGSYGSASDSCITIKDGSDAVIWA